MEIYPKPNLFMFGINVQGNNNKEFFFYVYGNILCCGIKTHGFFHTKQRNTHTSRAHEIEAGMESLLSLFTYVFGFEVYIKIMELISHANNSFLALVVLTEYVFECVYLCY